MLIDTIINMVFIMVLAIVGVPMSIQGSTKESVNERVTTLSEQVLETETQDNEPEQQIEMYPTSTYNKDWDADDGYLLAKIAMVEAEGCNTQTKTLVIMSVLNRVWSDEFPDTIEEVIKQHNGNVYQYSPLAEGGRWYTTEPNEDCYEAVRIVMEAQYDYSGGALYFESCSNEDNWHSRNLQFLYESDGLRFYK